MNLKAYIQILLMSMLLFSCSKGEVEKGDVEGIWFLKEIEGEEAAYIFGGGLPTINFDWDGQKIYGTGGCNRYSANYTLKGEGIVIDSLVSTEIFCENIETEKRFLVLLSKSTKIKVDDKAIVFMDGKKTLLRFLKLDLSVESGE